MNISLMASPVAAVYDRRPVFSTQLRSFLTCLFVGLTALSAVAQGTDNPTGVAGVFGPLSTTGCGYLPYTANATRKIDDLTVAGAVGSYPLQWGRIMNSRAQGGGIFGQGGGWSHSYRWVCSATESVIGAAPTSYTVTYPDGRVVTFAASVGTPYLAPVGVTDRFGGLSGNGYVYLWLRDGGKVRFYQTATYHSDDVQPYWTFTIGLPDQIIDPFGQITTLTYTSNKLTQVKEAGGRYLKISYGANGYVSEVDSYTASNHWTQWVKYTYASQTFNSTLYTVLTQADYIYSPGAEPQPIATYTYQSSNVSTIGNPLIATCNDVRYPGPMKNINYTFVRTSPLSYGELLQERNGDLTSVVTLSVDPVNKKRTETRGDGASRTFTYSATLGTGGTTKDYLLKSYTDFEGNTTTLSYNADGFVSSIEDANHQITTFEYLNQGFSTGVITKITHPSDSQTPLSSIQYFYTDATGAYLDHMIDELGNQTTYKRNSGTMTTYEIDYPDGGVESFIYNDFGQVLNHTMLTGGIEKYTYDTTGLLQTYAPPATPLDGDTNPDANPTRYHYDINDHVDTVTDPRGNVTTLYHNELGQLTIEQHPDNDPGVIVYSYNADTTLQAKSEQLDATPTYADSSYTYDDYKRLRTVTDPTGNKTSFWYDKTGNEADGYDHTESSVTRVKLPSLKVSTTLYDNNWRKKTVTVAPGTDDAATTTYTYDAVGNLKTMKDPNGQGSGATWTYNYDARDRLVNVIDPVAADRNTLGHTIDYTYDLAGNKKSERRANDQVVTYDTYDGRNRLTQMTVPQAPTAAAISHYTWTKFGKLDTLTDPDGKIYDYTYDELGRLRTLTYPTDSGGTARTEAYTYDKASNVASFKNRAGNIKTFTYDSRNRPILADWNTSLGQDVTTTYDDASRVTSVASGTGSTATTVAFGYDDAGQKLWEDQTVGGQTHRVNFTPDVDGNRATLSLSGVYSLNYDYTARNQLDSINIGTTTWYQYTYDPSGNLTKRQDKAQGLDSTAFEYDPMNRVTKCTQTGANDVAFAWSHYSYDKLGNIQSTWRDEQAGLGDTFGYDQNSQLTSANYNVAITSPTPTPSPTPSPTAATPTFAPVAAAYPASDYPKSITVSTTAGASIRYTTDNSTPTSGISGHGTLIGPTSGIATVPIGGATLKAIAYETGYIDSAIKTGTYSVAAAVVMPAFSPVAGAYPASDYPKSVTISTTTAGASMRYTTDGTTPTSGLNGHGTPINGISGIVSVANGVTLKAIAYKTGLTDSAINSGAYTQAASVATPTFSPVAGGYKSQSYPLDITISTTTTGAHIWYTTDNSTPSEGHGTLINATSGVVTDLAAGKTLKAIGLKSGLTDSAIKTGTYTALPPCAQPVFNPPEMISGPHPPALYKVHISTTTSGASLSYTKDGSTPTPTHGIIVADTSMDFTVAPNTGYTLSAIAFKSSGYSDSAVTSAYFDNQNGGLGPVQKWPRRGQSAAARPGDGAAPESAVDRVVALARVQAVASAAEAPGGAKWALHLVDTLWKQAGAGQVNLSLGWTSQGGQGNSQQGSTDATVRYVTYTLDSAGNRTNMTDGSSVSYVPNNLNQYSTVNGSSLGYDLNGNLASYGGWNYSYDADNRLVSASGGGHTVSFVYDGLGRCLQRTIDSVTTTFTYDGWKPIAEWDTTGARTAWNIYGPGPDEILMRYRASDASYLHYHSDQFGNVEFLLDFSNVGKEKYSYDAFGAPTVTNWDGTLPRSQSNYGNRFMSTGREYLSEANLYDYRARAYSPEVGRFLQPDPIGFSGDPANLYRYCANNPTNASDPMGTDPVDHGDYYSYIVPGSPDSFASLAAGGYRARDRNTGAYYQCAGIAQVLGGGYDGNGQFHDVPDTEHWFEGASLDSGLNNGTIVARGWAPDGGYPNDQVNHTLWLAFYDHDNNAILYSGTKDHPIYETTVRPEDQWQYHEVDVAKGDGPLGPLSQGDVIAVDPNTRKPVYYARAVSPTPNTLYLNNGLYGTWGNPRYQAGSALSQYVPIRKPVKKKGH